MSKPTPNRRRAFTLIELLSAISLASLLVISVVAIVSMCERQMSRLAQDPAMSYSDLRLANIVFRDLTNARMIDRKVDGSVALTGCIRIQNGRSAMGEAEVTYECRSRDEMRVLCRTQRSLGNAQTQPLRNGVERIALVNVDDDGQQTASLRFDAYGAEGELLFSTIVRRFQ